MSKLSKNRVAGGHGHCGGRLGTSAKGFGPDADQRRGRDVPLSDLPEWFTNTAKVDPSVRFNYQSIGSGGGQNADSPNGAILGRPTAR